LQGGGDLEVEVVHLVVLDRPLRATTKKVVNVFEKKIATPDKIMSTPMQWMDAAHVLHLSLQESVTTRRSLSKTNYCCRTDHHASFVYYYHLL